MIPKKSSTPKDSGSSIALANKLKPMAPAKWYMPCIITKPASTIDRYRRELFLLLYFFIMKLR